MTYRVLFVAAFLFAVRAVGQESIVLVAPDAALPLPTGNLAVDLVGQRDPRTGPMLQESGARDAAGMKSPWLAAGMSLLIPGTGEFYAESYWKAAIFFAVEVAAITWSVTNEKKGDDQTAVYQSFANAHWDVVRYAERSEPLAPATQGPYLWNLGGGVVNWDELNRMERAIGTWYSHTLPPYGSQQYYELIGKYPQFAKGWDDADPQYWNDYESQKANLPPNYLDYSEQRGVANDYYSRASTGIIIVVVNHVLSAADAAWSAVSYNKGLSASVGFGPAPMGAELLAGPALTLRYGI